MKFGPVLTYANIEEAKKLIGKKFLFCDELYAITEVPVSMAEDFPEDIGTLSNVFTDLETFNPFTKDEERSYQFIREIVDEPKYRAFTCEEAKQHIGKIVRRDRCLAKDSTIQGEQMTKDEAIKQIIQSSQYIIDGKVCISSLIAIRIIEKIYESKLNWTSYCETCSHNNKLPPYCDKCKNHELVPYGWDYDESRESITGA